MAYGGHPCHQAFIPGLQNAAVPLYRETVTSLCALPMPLSTPLVNTQLKAWAEASCCVYTAQDYLSGANFPPPKANVEKETLAILPACVLSLIPSQNRKAL